MKKFIFISILFFLAIPKLNAQSGFSSLTELNPIEISANTGEKPQAKIWSYAGKHWAVLPNSSGTHLWRLDGTTWTNILKLSSKTSSKADCRMVGNVAHILLFQGASSQLVSVEYFQDSGTYKLWSKRTSTVGLNLKTSTEIATIDIDGAGRMWMAFDGKSDINVSWSDSPYKIWSPPLILASNVSTDDISAVIALPGMIGVLWSNQSTKRFGFKTHIDGASPTNWSNDEVPASQSALNIGYGMADDHLNMAVSSNGTLYCAVKTSYDNSNYPDVALLVRRSNGNWDNLYKVSSLGTRPIVVLNEDLNKLRVVYTQITGDGNIVYNESTVNNISFGPQLRLISGSYNNSTSTKDNFSSEIVILASSSNQAVGVLARDGNMNTAPDAPILSSPADLSMRISDSPDLSWVTSEGATSYEAQVSVMADFSTTIFSQNNISGTSIPVSRLTKNSTYYWRVRATNSNGDSDWSVIWSFNTATTSSTATLVGHWKLDEGSGTMLGDASAYGNNATTSANPTWVTGVEGQALRFNGSSQYATANDDTSLDLSHAITVAGWIRPEKTGTQYLIKKAGQNGVDGYELSLSSNGTVFFRFNQETSGNNYRLDSKTSSYPKDGNTWMHVAATYDGEVIRMYIDGVENSVKVVSSSSLININELALTIGAGNNGYRGFQGAIDDVRIYNIALSASEINGLAMLEPTPVIVSAPILSSPADMSKDVSVSPGLSWNSSEDATSYEAQVSVLIDFSTTVFSQNNMSETSVSVSGLAKNTTYYWRVRATNSAGDSDWSTIWSFTTASDTTVVNAPILSSPADLSTGVSVTPTLVWNSSLGADFYSAQVSSSTDFSMTVFDQNNISGTSVSVSGLAENTAYYWRVLATNSAGDSDWSTIWSFTTASDTTLVNAPILSSPADLSTGVSVTPTLVWNSSLGADFYSAQVSSSTDFLTTVFNQNNISGTSVSVSDLAENTAYYWRVRATNSNGDSDWSTIWSFNTATTFSTATLVGHWKMDEGSGTMLGDASDYGNNATTSANPIWVTGVEGQALRFNGSSQYATAKDDTSLDVSNAITIAGWIRPEKIGTQYLIKKAEQKLTDGYELSLASNGKIFFRFNQNSYGDTYRLNSQTNYPKDGNTWMHVAATFDGTAIRIYIDGIENSIKTFSSPSAIMINDLAFTIGAGNDGFRGFQGAMDDVRIYNVALSAPEINELVTLNSGLKIVSTVMASSKDEKPPMGEFQEKFFAYPNPFSMELLTVSFSLSADSAYSLTLFDNRGAKITDLQNGEVLAGELNTIEVDGSWLPTGLYLVRLQTDKGETKTIRLIHR